METDPSGNASASSLGNARPLEAYLESAQALDAEAFASEHGEGFLIVTATSVTDAGVTNTRLLLALDDDAVGGRTADVSTVVYPIRGLSSAPGHLVTVGREAKHDIVIPDASVSRFHAFLKSDESGVFAVQDMASTNGTTVNGSGVPARGAGPPTPVKPGDNVCFGQVQLTFTDARALREFVLQAAG